MRSQSVPADTTNRELVFRYCGTKLDKEMACGKNSSVGRGGHMTGISGDVNCCSNRDVELCNGQPAVGGREGTVLLALVLVLSLGIVKCHVT